jgi:hypothetical protein
MRRRPPEAGLLRVVRELPGGRRSGQAGGRVHQHAAQVGVVAMVTMAVPVSGFTTNAARPTNVTTGAWGMLAFCQCLDDRITR